MFAQPANYFECTDSQAMRILLLSRYGRLGASSRLRSYQYLSRLAADGLDITVSPLLDDDYIKGLYGHGVPLAKVISSYFRRLVELTRASSYDLLWVEKEMFPWFPGLLERLPISPKSRLVVDYDDALFHRYDQHRSAFVRSLLGNKIDAVMKRADVVIVGNDYLGSRARQAGARRIEWLPTVVDTTRYTPRPRRKPEQPLTIGWIGSPSTAHFLTLVAPALQEIVSERDIRIVAVGANANQLAGLPIEVRNWTETSEVSEIQNFDIGIMPLSDTPFERGKCGYKLIQYMACGIPVIASPVGANMTIVRHGVDGLHASAHNEWVDALETLIDDEKLRSDMGASGRKRVEERYSLMNAAPRLSQLLRSIV